MRGFFGLGGKFRPVSPDDERPDQPIPDDIWVKCTGCGELIYSKELRQNARVCPKCGFHFRLRARERIFLLADDASFHERDGAIQPEDPLHFVDGGGPYHEKLARTQIKSGETESIVTGRATIRGYPVVLAVSDFDFLGASMGSVFGEKLVRAVERSLRSGDPLLTISASGGARMHEGPFSLMQMAKTVSALARLGRAGVPHIALLTDPCYGGVTASYTMVADVILAEPGAMIGFAGPRVIEQITKQKLPEGFQTAEFLLEHGMIDLIADRPSLRSTLTTFLAHYDRARSARQALRPATSAVAGAGGGSGPDLNGSQPDGADAVLADLFPVPAVVAVGS